MDYKAWIPLAVKALRGERTLKDFATSTGYSISYLSDIEQGRAVPTFETLDQIATRSGAALVMHLDIIPFQADSEYVLMQRSEMEDMLKAVDRFRYVYAQMQYLMHPDYTPEQVRQGE
jgi:transcriptional regulator with XRE-family HTH domain